MPLTCQLTALLAVLVTVAGKVCVRPAWPLAAAGVTDRSTGAGTGGGRGGGGGGGDGGCGAVAPLSPDPPPPHPARCSSPATSPATMRRLPEISGGSVIGPRPRLALRTLRTPRKLPG